MQLTKEQWNQLSQEEKRNALLRFEEPDNIYKPKTNYVNLNEEKI